MWFRKKKENKPFLYYKYGYWLADSPDGSNSIGNQNICSTFYGWIGRYGSERQKRLAMPYAVVNEIREVARTVK